MNDRHPFFVRLEHDYELVIVRLYRSNGVVDWSACQNIRNARIAGFQHIEVYFLPCRFCEEPIEQVRQKPTIRLISRSSFY